MMLWVTITTAADCQYHLSPCICSFNEFVNSYSILCDKVPMADVAPAFKPKPALDIDRLDLIVNLSFKTYLLCELHQ